MKDDRVYLKYIRDCMVRINEYTKGGREEFLKSTLIQDAVLRNLHTLTESTQRLSSDLKAKHPHVDWKRIAGFRNVLVHSYLEIDLDIVWRILQESLPVLESDIRKILRSKTTVPVKKKPVKKKTREVRKAPRRNKDIT